MLSLAPRSLVLALCAIGLTDGAAVAQSTGPRQPPASSRRFNGRDGDVVLLNGDDRLTVVRRREGNVRLLFDAARSPLIVLSDFSGPAGNPTDGRVDWIYTFAEMSGEWPLGPRWDGIATIDEYWHIDGGRREIVIATPAAVVELGTPMTDGFPRIDPAPSVRLTFRRGGTRQGSGASFDEAERRAGDPAVQGDAQLSMSVVGGVVSSGDAPRGPVRVGGNVRPPTKLFDVKAVYPDKARGAGVRGSVILEITIGTDGAVTDARVLRSIPLLDEAALQAVRQWRFDPTLLNGVPVPVILTVSVPFP